MTYPKLIVFDLDFTLWNAGGTWCDHLRAPFHCRDGCVLDADGAMVTTVAAEADTGTSTYSYA